MTANPPHRHQVPPQDALLGMCVWLCGAQGGDLGSAERLSKWIQQVRLAAQSGSTGTAWWELESATSVTVSLRTRLVMRVLAATTGLTVRELTEVVLAMGLYILYGVCPEVAVREQVGRVEAAAKGGTRRGKWSTTLALSSSTARYLRLLAAERGLGVSALAEAALWTGFRALLLVLSVTVRRQLGWPLFAWDEGGD